MSSFSSVGRAPVLYAVGQGFEPLNEHFFYVMINNNALHDHINTEKLKL